MYTVLGGSLKSKHVYPYWHKLNIRLTLHMQLTLAFAAINDFTTSVKPLAEAM